MGTANEELETKALTLTSQAREISIVTPEDYLRGGEFLKACQGYMAEVAGAWDSVIEKAYAAHKEACAKKKAYYAPAEAAYKAVDAKMIGWKNEQDRIASSGRWFNRHHPSQGPVRSHPGQLRVELWQDW